MKIVHKTSNICRKRHRIVEIHLSYRKSMSPEQMAGPFFDRKFLNSRFCACTVKICLKVSKPLTISPKFCHPYRKSWSLNTMVTADFRLEAELTLFLRMRTKKIAKSPGKYIPIEELFPYYRKWTSLERMAGSDIFTGSS